MSVAHLRLLPFEAPKYPHGHPCRLQLEYREDLPISTNSSLYINLRGLYQEGQAEEWVDP
jgi:hypothetical protein